MYECAHRAPRSLLTGIHVMVMYKALKDKPQTTVRSKLACVKKWGSMVSGVGVFLLYSSVIFDILSRKKKDKENGINSETSNWSFRFCSVALFIHSSNHPSHIYWALTVSRVQSWAFNLHKPTRQMGLLTSWCSVELCLNKSISF